MATEPAEMETAIQPAAARRRLDRLVADIGRVVLGKEREVRLALTCLLAGGNLLIEDIPGVGKTTLAHALARALDLKFQRIQFTSDLLPADIIGVQIYEREGGDFRFRPGPLFAELILADEVNRATPKTQSALLEAMEERQVTVDGATRRLPEPFFVIATQNPQNQVGTYPLPESQLDRFPMCITLGYPDHEAERSLLGGLDPRRGIDALMPELGVAGIAALQTAVREVHVADAWLDYLQAVVYFTRASGRYLHGLSPRAALHLKWTAQAWALMAGRSAVLPEDLQAVLESVVTHRLVHRSGDGGRPQAPAREILEAVAIP